MIQGATMTLRGIAGIVLTVGMAVDANVLIFTSVYVKNFERDAVLAKNNSPRLRERIQQSYDANITTLLTAIILFAVGTGAIKGFAVTLSIGIHELLCLQLLSATL
ncbi:hypothetical protein OH492_24015 [Vibrio chagasii]|nr:hypothetical protein [Vibrio chagasii]